MISLRCILYSYLAMFEPRTTHPCCCKIAKPCLVVYLLGLVRSHLASVQAIGLNDSENKGEEIVENGDKLMKRTDEIYEEAGDLSDDNDFRTTAKVEDYEAKVENYWIDSECDFVGSVDNSAADGLCSSKEEHH